MNILLNFSQLMCVHFKDSISIHYLLTTLNFEYQVRHNLQWEGVWRELSCLSRTTTFPVREQAGHSLKSALRHVINFDNRDSPVFSSRGTLFRMVQELAGLGGDVGFIKQEVNCQVNVPVTSDIVSHSRCLFQKKLMPEVASFND